jgi:hypothetical protein
VAPATGFQVTVTDRFPSQAETPAGMRGAFMVISAGGACPEAETATPLPVHVIRERDGEMHKRIIKRSFTYCRDMISLLG